MRDLNRKHRYPGGKGGAELLIGVCSVQRAGPFQKADPPNEPGQFPKYFCLAGEGLTSFSAALVPLEQQVGQLDITHELISVLWKTRQIRQKRDMLLPFICTVVAENGKAWLSWTHRTYA